MIELGNKHHIDGAEHWPTIPISGRPASWPKIRSGSAVAFGFDEGGGECIIVCDSLFEMQRLYDAFRNGPFAISLSWYEIPHLNLGARHCPQPGYLTLVA